MFKKAHGRYMHMWIAVAVLAVLWYLNLTYQWIVIPNDTLSLVKLGIVALVYANLADSDQPGSVMNKYVTTLLVGIIIWAFYFQQSQYGIIAAVIIGLLRWIEHRKVIHSVGVGAIVSIPLLYLGWVYFVVGLIAYITHLVSDGEFSLWAEKDWKILKR